MREYLKGTGYRGTALSQDEPAVTDKLVITAGGLAPVDFAYHIFKQLAVFSEPTLEAWRLLFKTGDPSHYLSLMKDPLTRHDGCIMTRRGDSDCRIIHDAVTRCWIVPLCVTSSKYRREPPDFSGSRRRGQSDNLEDDAGRAIGTEGRACKDVDFAVAVLAHPFDNSPSDCWSAPSSNSSIFPLNRSATNSRPLGV